MPANEESCSTCAYKKEREDLNDGLVIECHLLPPVVISVGPHNRPHSYLPRVREDSFCSQWKDNETGETLLLGLE